MKIKYPGKKTKTGQYSTDEETLQKLVHEHPIAEKILDYREWTKLKSTYVDALPSLINPKTQRLHTTFNQAVAATGRLSSTNPNLQNIPVRTERGRKIRQAFICKDKEHLLLSADYSQIELRIVASISEDENMIAAFNQHIDIHTATASNVFGVPLSEVTSEMRRQAKMVNFGIIYGISAFGLAGQLAGISANPWIRWASTDIQGYGVVTLTATEMVCQFRALNRLVGSTAPASGLIARTVTARIPAGTAAVTIS